MSDDKREPCDYCHACSTDVYALGGCYCKRFSQPPLDPYSKDTLRTIPQPRVTPLQPPVVEMARIAAPVDADGRPCEESDSWA